MYDICHLFGNYFHDFQLRIRNLIKLINYQRKREIYDEEEEQFSSVDMR